MKEWVNMGVKRVHILCELRHKRNGTLQLSAGIFPATVFNDAILWKVDNASLAQVSTTGL